MQYIPIKKCFYKIDIKTGTAERLRRAMDAFVSDRGRDPHVPTLFDDAQHTVFNELLPFWAGFVTAMSPLEREGKRPSNKKIPNAILFNAYHGKREKRLERFYSSDLFSI